MRRPAGESFPLLPAGGFVVQFRQGTALAEGRCTGRVEHVVSGEMAQFQSLEELIAFFARVLIEGEAKRL
jgi:hypothetical protein